MLSCNSPGCRRVKFKERWARAFLPASVGRFPGEVIAVGAPEEIVQCASSHMDRFLQKVLDGEPFFTPIEEREQVRAGR